VQVWWPLKFSYIIQGLAEDYSTVIVGVPNQSHVWIMAKHAEISEKRYQELVDQVRTMGCDVSKLEKSPKSNVHSVSGG
jgi:lipocalin